MGDVKRIPARKAVTIRLCVSALVVWLLFSLIVTFIIAEYAHDSFVRSQQDFILNGTYQISNIYERLLPIRDEDEAAFQEAMDREMLRSISNSNVAFVGRWNLWRTGRFSISLLRNVSTEMQTARIIFDSDGNVLRQSSGIVWARFVTEELWESGARVSDFSLLDEAFIVICNVPNDHSAMLLNDFYLRDDVRLGSMGLRFARLEGRFEGAEFIPYKYGYITWEMYWEAVGRTGVNLSETLRTVNHLVHSGELDWQLLFDNTNEATDELETIFFTDGLLTEYNPSDPISINGRRYDDLLLFLNQTALRSFLNNERQHPSFGGFVNFGFNNFGLSEVFVVGADALRDTRDFDFNADEPLPPFDYLILSAISGSPIHHAIRELFFVYMITFVIAAFAVFVTRRKLIKNIIEPVEALVKGYNAFNGGSDRHKYLDCGTPKWSEPFELTRIYMDTTEELHKSRIKENEEDEHNKA